MSIQNWLLRQLPLGLLPSTSCPALSGGSIYFHHWCQVGLVVQDMWLTSKS